MSCRCRFPKGITVKPDGVNSLDPCIYEDAELHTNVNVIVSQCKHCGHIEIRWVPTYETEHLIYKELAPEPEDD